jgi:hypothetical protein
MDTVTKQPSEAKGYNFDFAPRLAEGRRLQLVQPIAQSSIARPRAWCPRR